MIENRNQRTLQRHDDRDEPGTQRNPEFFGFRAADVLALLANQQIELTTVDGRIYRAELAGTDKYTITLKDAAGDLTLVQKSAVKMLRPAIKAGSA